MSEPDHTVNRYPLFLDLSGRRVVVVGGGTVAASKLGRLRAAGADVTVVAPEATQEVAELAAAGLVRWHERPFAPADLDGAWLALAATGDAAVNQAVADAAAARRIFVNAVDDKSRASAYAAAVVERGPVTVAISTGGRSPALCRLLREALDAVLPSSDDLAAWVAEGERLRRRWQEQAVPIPGRAPELLRRLLARYPDPGSVPGGPAAVSP